jgi:multidrug transporter EmrE-like cation transporter
VAGAEGADPWPTHPAPSGLDARAAMAETAERQGGPLVNWFGLLQLGFSTVIFLLAATVAKQWALAPTLGKLILTLALYSAGNLIMLRLVRDFGMASAFSLSAVIQLVAVNVIALAWFGERLTIMQSAGVVLAIVAVGMITIGPAFGGK